MACVGHGNSEQTNTLRGVDFSFNLSGLHGHSFHGLFCPQTHVALVGICASNHRLQRHSGKAHPFRQLHRLDGAQNPGATSTSAAPRPFQARPQTGLQQCPSRACECGFTFLGGLQLHEPSRLCYILKPCGHSISDGLGESYVRTPANCRSCWLGGTFDIRFVLGFACVYHIAHRTLMNQKGERG